MKLSIILLAAGLSRRMGCDKLLMEYDGKTLLQRAIVLLSDLPAIEKIIVSTEVRLGRVSLPQDVKAVINQHPEEGQSSSIRIGVENATGTHFLFLPADQPRLAVDDVMPLIKLSDENPDMIVHPVIDSEPCSPTLFPSTYMEQLLCLTGDTGGRVIRDRHSEACVGYVPRNPERFVDVDYLGIEN